MDVDPKNLILRLREWKGDMFGLDLLDRRIGGYSGDEQSKVLCLSLGFLF